MLEGMERSDAWFVLPRASDDLEITDECFKAFSRILIFTVSEFKAGKNDIFQSIDGQNETLLDQAD
ncbi:MAG: hypothetical protein COV74_04645 [Candidatus Omnitrophica bacterium CG11_big_fil_rev_8_21_14_0_20_45_26]|uniref:Uncharacterized protein n=1 Tax=Candidatus Abzuiibacterium crystallinum TaxID=1974748 RepID=A0A2H0LQ16_9BACT|nr:MAG: hypothetical protein COV74_04645 [Candidatus Omnitrophica bacterium CG11_big_fil_rev_8_21_14_0_20_45_26]PIW64051.1 MAG: hypothetical protein COW12_07770 [Candidatus Omnitrophica bacterium CG12_big_fil_rev_8_21_14_0_65_45_16]